MEQTHISRLKKFKASVFLAFLFLIPVTGLFWGTWFSLSRTMETFSAGEFIHIGKTIIANVAVPMAVIMPLCLVFLLLAIIFHPQKRSWRFYALVTTFALITFALVVTLVVEVLIDNRIKEWTAETAPPDWQSIRERWEFFHSLRTSASLGGTLLLIAALIF